MYNNYYGKSKEERLKQTEHEYFRDEAHVLFESKYTPSKNVEHKVEVNIIDKDIKDYFYKKQSFLRKVKHDTQCRNNTLRRLFRKRDFTKKEDMKFQELKKKIMHNIGLTYDEDMEFQYLNSIKFVKSDERHFRNVINDIDKIYYYKDARQRLKQRRRVEWNGDKTASREQVWSQNVLNKNPSVNIIVNKENLVDHSLNMQKKRMNTVIVNTVSHLNPGGSWEKGEEGSEESLFYRSSYELSLDGEQVRDGLYPLKEDCILYSPKVMIYKYGKNQQYTQFNQRNNPILLSSIACCGFRTIEYKAEEKNKKKIEVNKRTKRVTKKETKVETDKNLGLLKINKNLLSDKVVKIYKDKLHNIFQTALYWGHNTLVMDPLCCMVSSSDSPPPKHCASIIKEVIFDNENMYYKKFKYIAICVGIRSMTNVPKPTKSNDPNSYIYSKEHEEFLKEEKIYKIFHQTLHQVDKFSA